MSSVTISGLHKSFGSSPVLRGVDLHVPAGSITAVLGPSGTGKSTLLRLLVGFDAPDQGTIALGDTVVDGDGRRVPPEQRRIGYVPQEGALFPHLTVEANVGFGLPRSERHQVGTLLELVDLAGLGRRYPHQLSGGQQQRVALARALAIKPQVVALDEPFSSLDPHLRSSVRSEVEGVLRSAGTTTVLVTHDQAEALSMADLVAVMREGRIVQCDTPQGVYARPADAELAHFVGEANLLGGTYDGNLVHTCLGSLDPTWRCPRPAGPCPVTVLVRPEQIRVRQASEDGVGMPGCVLRCEYFGHDATASVQPQFDASGRPILVRLFGETNLRQGSSVSLTAQGPALVWPVEAGESGTGT
ncbi:MAG: ABC transporter ATP-binding protein [Actinomycetota bacterium]